MEKGFDAITTEILPAPTFYFAEKLLAVSAACPIGTGVSVEA